MLVKMICPQCGAALEIDDNREFMFCQFCGTKIVNLAEKIDVKLSGSVTVDESAKLVNYLRLAQNALNSRNYGEAYSYYSHVLEIDPNNFRATLYKGLTAVLQSTPYRDRTTEGMSSLRSLATIRELTAEDSYAVGAFTRSVIDTIPAFFNNQCSVMANQPLGSSQDVSRLFILSYNIVSYIVSIVSAINANLLHAVKNLEAAKRSIILIGIDLAKRAGNPLSYVSQYVTKADRNGRMITEPQIARVRCPYTANLQTITRVLIQEYNTLPTTVAKLARINGDLARQKQLIDSFEAELNSYFKVHPENEKAYRHPGIFGREKKIASIEESFPRELLEKKALSVKAAEESAQLEKQKKIFIKENLMKL